MAMDWRRLGRQTGWISAGFSLAAFALSLFTFYFTYLQGADITANMARVVSFQKQQGMGFWAFTIPLTFVNDGGQHGVVERIDLIVTHEDGSERVLRAHERIDRFQTIGAFAPVSVAPRGSVTVDFGMAPVLDPTDPIFPKPGDYRITLAVWVRDETRPRRTVRHTRIGDAELALIARNQQRLPILLDTVVDPAELRNDQVYTRDW